MNVSFNGMVEVDRGEWLNAKDIKSAKINDDGNLVLRTSGRDKTIKIDTQSGRNHTRSLERIITTISKAQSDEYDYEMNTVFSILA